MEVVQKDSFTIGTPATKGAIKVYFTDSNAEEKIKKAKKWYYEFVELERIKGGLKK